MFRSIDQKSFKIPIRWFLGGLFLLGFFFSAIQLSPAFSPDIPATDYPYERFVFLMVLAGMAYLFLIEGIVHTHAKKQVLLWVLFLGVTMRLAAIASTPILEDDYHRYLWDGAVTAIGLNPYSYSPDAIKNKAPNDEFVKVKESGAAHLNQINHSYLRTIYPPVTQFFFAMAHWIYPWSITAWKIVLLLMDVITAFLLFKLVAHLALSPLWLAAYWLNPLLIKEIFNSAHMDLLIFPFLLAALLLVFQNRPLWASIFIAFAGAIKIWPLALFPILFRPWLKQPLKLLIALSMTLTLSAIFFWPVYATGLDSGSGLNAYSQRWQLNDSLFLIIFSAFDAIYNLFDLREGFAHLYAQQSARGVVALLCLALIFWYSFSHPGKKQELIRRCLMVVTAIFMLSPTQFPWYAIWIVPLLVLYQRRSLFMLTALMPLYYLWHCYNLMGRTDIFSQWIVWVEFVPVWLVFLYEWRLNRQSLTATPTEVAEGYEERLANFSHHPRFE